MSLCLTIKISKAAHILWIFVFVFLIFASQPGFAQETIFSLLQPDAEKADSYYNSKNYHQALDLYIKISNKSNDDQYWLKIARSYHYVNQHKDAANWYAKYLAKKKELPLDDIFIYAESLSALKQYDEAIGLYTQYLNHRKDDPICIKKIWRLKNREYLYEDSIHYTVKLLNTNSNWSDLCPVMYGQGILFMSNRERQTVISQVDASNSQFYRLYYSGISLDTVNDELHENYAKPMLFSRELSDAFHEGPVAFYDDQHRMIYTATGDPSEKDKSKRTLQLYFAEHQDGRWTIVSSFPYNSKEYSITDPFMRKDGTVMYFSSDMPGGLGGKDIYQSSFMNGTWGKPVNLGEQINTSGDESFPIIHGNSLYFTSNGHAGLGGLDIFSATVELKGFGEAQNIGYPVNTNFDDFAIILSDDGTKGYFSSNRKGGNDDIYEVSIDLQSYPFMITGILKYKEESWKDSAELKIYPNAQLSLIDNLKNKIVETSTSGPSGDFSLAIPYFSQYRIKVIGGYDLEENFVSLELTKRRTSGNQYEIVVVKNAFKKSTE